MKNKLQKAVFVALTAAIGITLVTFVKGGRFSLFNTCLYMVVAFVADFAISFIFDKKG